MSHIDYLEDTQTMTVTCPPGLGGPLTVMCDVWGDLEWYSLAAVRSWRFKDPQVEHGLYGFESFAA